MENEKQTAVENTTAQADIAKVFMSLQDLTSDNLQPATAIEAVRLATALLNLVGSTGDAPEYMGDCKLDPDTMGQLLMEHLPIPDMGFNVDQKVYWMKVATHLGPDWINELRRSVAFMQKVDSF